MSRTTIDAALDQIRSGRPVIVVDDEQRENEGDLVFAAELASQELVAFTVRHTSGYVCVPVTAATAERLQLTPMHHTNEDRFRTAYTVTVDARAGVTTGISAADRAHTMRLLADPQSVAGDLVRPGHIVPLRAVEGGVLRRGGHTEAAVDLARLAGLQPAGVICELVNDDGTMMRLPDLRRFAAEHQLALISIADLIAYRRRSETHVKRMVEARLPTEFGTFTVLGYRDTLDGHEHLALVVGNIGDGDDVLVRLHSECLTGDTLGSVRCDCGPQLRTALARVADEGRGVVVYLRGHEGRGIGLIDKLRAYGLQDSGFDTADANVQLGLPVDARDYGIGAQMLDDIGVRSVRLLSNNPAKQAGLQTYGIGVVGLESLATPVHAENEAYLRTKRDRLGHRLDHLAALTTDRESH